MWKAAALVVLSLALEGAFILNAVVPDPGAMRRAVAESRIRQPGPPAVPEAISAGAIARAR